MIAIKVKDIVTTCAATLCASWSLWIDFIGNRTDALLQ